MECSGVLPSTMFVNRKGLGTCDALLCMPHTLGSALENWRAARIRQIYLTAAFESVFSISVGIGGSMLSILKVLSNRSQHIMVDGCQSKQTYIMS